MATNRLSSLARLRHHWNTSLRFRLMALGLVPLLVAFPVVIAVLLLIGGERANNLMYANVQSSQASAVNYLDQVSTSASRSVSQIVRSERLVRLLKDSKARTELNEMLRTTAQGIGLDYLIIIDSQRRILAASTSVEAGTLLPDSYVIRQAQTGIASSAFERFEAEQLDRYSPRFSHEARVQLVGEGEQEETRGMLLNAAAHFPLMANDVDAILVGGTLINHKYPLIEHLREILFPVGILPGDVEGMALMSLDDRVIAISRQRHQGQREMGILLPSDVVSTVMRQGMTWLGRNDFSGNTFMMGYEPIQDGEGNNIGILGVGFPNAPYLQSALLILGIVSLVLALAMLAISFVFLRAGKQLSVRLGLISATMNRVGAGDRSARTQLIGHDDEVGQLTRHFNRLLDLNEREEETRRTAEAELHAYRKHLERLVELRTLELNTRNEQLDAIFALSPDGFVSFDREHKVSFVNAAFLRMTGLADGEVIGLDEATFSRRLISMSEPSAVFPGISMLRAERTRLDAFARHEETEANVPKRSHFELSGPGSRVIEISLRMGEMEGVSQVLYCRDVTHETEVDRMKSEFLSHAAHELRTPMASVLGYAELLLAMDFSEEERREYLEVIHRQANLLVSIINELLDLARIEARHGKDFVLEKLELHALLKDVIAGWKVPDGRDKPIVAGNHEGIWLRADRKKLMQALGNVVSNAYKYSPMGGDVSIELIRQQESGNGQARIGIQVSDQGIGMTQEQQARVCERFYRADTTGKIPGSGLGMSIVKEIIELHGGSLEIASQPGNGTQMLLWLPLGDWDPERQQLDDRPTALAG